MSSKPAQSFVASISGELSKDERARAIAEWYKWKPWYETHNQTQSTLEQYLANLTVDKRKAAAEQFNAKWAEIRQIDNAKGELESLKEKADDLLPLGTVEVEVGGDTREAEADPDVGEGADGAVAPPQLMGATG